MKDGTWVPDVVDLLAEPEPPIPDRWGNWVLNRRLLTLTTTDGGYAYEIDLEDITDSAQMLDWIFQIHNKTWNNGQTVSDLVRAFEDLFSPQANLCSFGKNRTINPKSFLRARLQGDPGKRRKKS